MRQRFALLAMLFLPPDPGTFFVLARSSTKMIWISPTSKTSYASGDTITGKWKASKALVSPSVSLCFAVDGKHSGEEEGCGKALWPNIADDGDQYSFSLGAPNIVNNTANPLYYLKLKDDFGHVEKSPKFAIIGSKNKESASTPANDADADAESDDGHISKQSSVTPSPETSLALNANPGGSESGMISTTISIRKATSVTKSTSKSLAVGEEQPDATAQVGFSTSVAGSTGTLGSRTTITTITVQSLAPAQLSTNSHAQISAVAVAVPLSLVAVTLLASVLLCHVHRKSVASQRQRNVDLLATSGNMVHSSSQEPLGGPSDVEKAINALHYYEHEPPPTQTRAVYVPVQVKHPIPRPDARRDRMYNSRTSTPFTCVERHSYLSDYQPYAGACSDERQRYFAENTFGPDDSATEAVLSEYISTPSHMYLSEIDSQSSSRSLRHPPRLHSRCSAPDPYYGREGDLYEAVSRAVSHSRSHDSNSVRY